MTGARSVIRFILKSGERFDVLAEKAKVRSCPRTGDLQGWEFDGVVHPRPLYVRIDDVSAVLDMGPET